MRIVKALFLFAAISLTIPEKGVLAFDLPVSPAHYFNDYASLIDAQVAQQLDQRLEGFERQTSNQIVVVIYPSLPADAPIEDFALAAFRAWKIGQQGKNNGVLLMVLVKEREVRITTGDGLEAFLTNTICKQIISDEIAPHFSLGDFGGGLTAAISAMMAAIRDAYTGTGKTLAEQNAADRQAAQQGSPINPAPTTVHQPDSANAVDHNSSQDEAVIQYMIQQYKMGQNEAELAFAKQPAAWTRWAQQPIPGESILTMPTVYTQGFGQEPPTQTQIITARQKLAAQNAANQARTQAARQAAEQNQRVLQQAGITIEGVRNLIRQAVAARNGTPVGQYPMTPVYLNATGRTIAGAQEWEAYFTTYNRQPIVARGYGSTVTSIIGSIVDNL